LSKIGAMTRHYSEADLLETWFEKPGAPMPVMMHLADCPPCAERYERVEAKMRGLHVCPRRRSAFGRLTDWFRKKLR